MSHSKQPDMFSAPTATIADPPSEPIFEIEIPGRLPSWNEILGLEQWKRYAFKKELAAVFLSSLRATGADCSMKTTCAKNTMLTFAATLERYLATKQAERKSKLARKRSEQKSANLFESKSSNSKGKVPF